MLKKLRKKFIAIAMCSIGIVLAIIMTGINLANYMNVCRNADARISMISDNDGHLPEESDNTPPPKQGDDKNTKDQKPADDPGAKRQMSPEASFDTRFFTVTLTDDGTIEQIDTGKIAAITTQEASDYATSLYKKGKRHGFVSCYRYQAVTLDDSENITYIFVNCERELNTFQAFLLASIGISLAGLLVVFLLVVIFSKIVLRPVAESYEKQKRFITDASHEIKTPLTIIDANTEVLEMTEGENQWTKSTRKQIARLTSLTEKLVFLSRMDEESTTLDMQNFAISDAVIDTAEPFIGLAASRGKTLTCDIAPDLTYCEMKEVSASWSHCFWTMPSSIPQTMDKSAFLSTMPDAISSFRCGIQRIPFRLAGTTNCSSAFTAPTNPATRKPVDLASASLLSMRL